MRIVFLGTPEFAVPSLRALAAHHQVIAVFTQPDRPKGRGQQLSESPVKIAAKELGIPVHQPERIRRPEAIESVRRFEPELIAVVGYGQIVPQAVIDIARYGILNVHASLLPKYRGAAPIQWAIANGESETGVTIMQIDAGLDTGDMLLKAKTKIGEDETAPELSRRLAPMGAALLIDAIGQIGAGSVRREKQDDAAASMAPILKKGDGQIDWSRSASEIYNRFRGFQPWPGAYSSFRGQPVNITAMRPAQMEGLAPGMMLAEKRRLYAGCDSNSAVEIFEVQLAGKKRSSVEAFLNGYQPRPNEQLGDGR